MIWIKDNGDEIKLNDEPATIAHCQSLGWKEKKAAPRKKKAVRKPKE